MPTEKFSNEKTVKIQSSITTESANDLSAFLPRKNTAHRLFRILLFAFLLITLFSLAKIPYCGSYIDAYIFEFVIGTYVKFIAYFFLIVFFIAKIINWKFTAFLISKKFLIAGLLLIISGIIISGFVDIFTSDKSNFTSFMAFLDFGKIVNNYLNRFKSNTIYINHFKPFIWHNWLPGFIGSITPDLYGIIVIIIAGIIVIVLLTVAVLFLTNKTRSQLVVRLRKWIIKRLRLGLNISGSNELETKSSDVKPNILQKSLIKQEAIQIASFTPPISFLSETSIDNYLVNKAQTKQYADIITAFLHKFDSIIQLQKTITAPLYCEITYDVEKPSIVDEIFSSQNEILNELKIQAFNVLYKNNTVRFEIANTLPSKISLRSVYSLLKNINTDKAIIGVDEESKPLQIDITRKQNIVLIGTYGSGVTMLMITILISLAYTNNPKAMEMVILSPNNDKVLKHLSMLPHLLHSIKNEQHEITRILISIQDQINKRELQFKSVKAWSLEDYNATQMNDIDKLKRIVVAVFNFNLISKISLQNRNLIIDILNRGPQIGITTILLANNVDQELLNSDLYKLLDVKLLMKLEFEQESIQLLDSKRGIELFGNGDGYFFDSETKKYTRFQACYMNVDELVQTIKIIETFYAAKSKLN